MKLNDFQLRFVEQYYRDLANYKKLNKQTESTTEMAFKSLLKNIGDTLDLILIKPYESIAKGKGIIPDGILTNTFGRYVGYWEAKDTKDDLEQEIYKKLQNGYPRTNTIFEDTQKAVLYQDNAEVGRFDLSKKEDLVKLLTLFFGYNEPILEDFKKAVEKFKENIKPLANTLQGIIAGEKEKNKHFRTAVQEFVELCSKSFHSDIRAEDVEDMLIQHLLTERIFRKMFDNADFVNKNAIAVQLEKLVTLLTQSSFSRSTFFKDIDFFYVAIEEEASQIDNDTEKQNFLNNIYELFFKSYSIKNSDKNGIVYTPQSIVRFMVKFSNALFKEEFGKTISDEGVTIIDPCVGTGNFIVEVLKNIERHGNTFARKYEKEIFCNELMLLPYYIACVNIEYYYFKETLAYKPFENIVFADTLELIKDETKAGETHALFAFNEANTERAKRQLANEFVFIIGNPPYSAVGDETESKAFKNAKNKVIDKAIAETYAKESKATLKSRLYDAYVKFFRWATDRLAKEDGIICFVSNNSFLNETCFDGMRKLLLQDFQRIYHVDLGGNVKKNGKLSGTKHNVFGIQLGVGITFLVRNTALAESKFFYKSFDTFLTKEEKWEILDQMTEKHAYLHDMIWQEATLSKTNAYLFDAAQLQASQDFEKLFPLYSETEPCIFKHKYPGINTARTEWVYDFDKDRLLKKIEKTTDFYNAEVDRLDVFYKSAEYDKNRFNINNFIIRKDSHVKWSDGLKSQLQRLKPAYVSDSHIVSSLFRPFTKSYLYYDRIFVDRPSEFGILQQASNQYICYNGLGQQKGFSTIITNLYPEFQTAYNCQTVPLYYVETNQEGIKIHSNIQESALAHFQAVIDDNNIDAEDIFYYVYAIFHHEGYKQKYADVLKSTAPRVPISPTHFHTLSRAGKALADLHLNFESAKPYDLRVVESGDAQKDYHIKRMNISKKDGNLYYNNYYSIVLPEGIHDYKANGRSPIQWIADQYEDFPAQDDSIIELIKRLATVSFETVALLEEIQKVKI